MESAKSTAMKGAIGEFYVASYLSALGLVVALPRGGVPSSDLLVTTPSGNKAISLQVKTATKPLNSHRKYGEYLTWRVSPKLRDKNNSSSSHWYVFVALQGWPKEGNSPELYFVPSQDVADSLNTDWNKLDETSPWYPIFVEINAETENYVAVEKNATFYKGLEGFKKIADELMV